MKIEDTYEAVSIAGAIAAAVQAMSTFSEEGFHAVQISADRLGSGYVVHVTYEQSDEAAA